MLLQLHGEANIPAVGHVCWNRARIIEKCPAAQFRGCELKQKHKWFRRENRVLLERAEGSKGSGGSCSATKLYKQSSKQSKEATQWVQRENRTGSNNGKAGGEGKEEEEAAKIAAGQTVEEVSHQAS